MSLKTGGLDETILMDLPRHAGFVPTMELLRSGDPDAPLLDQSQEDFAREFSEIGKEVGVDILGPVAYHFRHSGASNDHATKARTQSETKERGRWIADASVRRYNKGVRLADQLSRLSQAVRDAAVAAERGWAKTLNAAWVVDCRPCSLASWNSQNRRPGWARG